MSKLNTLKEILGLYVDRNDNIIYPFNATQADKLILAILYISPPFYGAELVPTCSLFASENTVKDSLKKLKSRGFIRSTSVDGEDIYTIGLQLQKLITPDAPKVHPVYVGETKLDGYKLGSYVIRQSLESTLFDIYNTLWEKMTDADKSSWILRQFCYCFSYPNLLALDADSRIKELSQLAINKEDKDALVTSKAAYNVKLRDILTTALIKFWAKIPAKMPPEFVPFKNRFEQLVKCKNADAIKLWANSIGVSNGEIVKQTISILLSGGIVGIRERYDVIYNNTDDSYNKEAIESMQKYDAVYAQKKQATAVYNSLSSDVKNTERRAELRDKIDRLTAMLDNIGGTFPKIIKVNTKFKNQTITLTNLTDNGIIVDALTTNPDGTALVKVIFIDGIGGIKLETMCRKVALLIDFTDTFYASLDVKLLTDLSANEAVFRQRFKSAYNRAGKLALGKVNYNTKSYKTANTKSDITDFLING